MSGRTSAEAVRILEDAVVPVGPIYNVADMMNDEHFNARGLFQEVSVDGQPLKVPAIMPLLCDTPGRTESAGPKIGEHTDAVLERVLGLSADERARLRAAKVI
jgi:crotonobetainyl-CoA:carnitine CoA-transferase CaiB-like acyl-CoA transferase